MLKKVSLLSLVSIGLLSQIDARDINSELKQQLQKQLLAQGQKTIVDQIRQFEYDSSGRSVLLLSDFMYSDIGAQPPVADYDHLIPFGLIKNNQMLLLEDISPMRFNAISAIAADFDADVIPAGTIIYLTNDADVLEELIMIVLLQLEDAWSSVVKKEGLEETEELGYILFDNCLDSLEQAGYQVKYNKETCTLIVNGISLSHRL